MLTIERQETILSLLKEKETIKIQEIVEITGSSESTIRRDLKELEQSKKLKRIHGGATLFQKKLVEPTVAEKTVKNRQEKQMIAKKAADLIEEGDCLFLDAGTSTVEMIPFLKGKDIVVVTNGLNNIAELLEAEIETHVVGGYVKKGTRAFVGRGAIQSLRGFRFDKAFIGTNGISLKDGCTTPDPEEAFIKEEAIKLAAESFVLADHTKFGEVSFSKFADVKEVIILTSAQIDSELRNQISQATKVEVFPS
ncbi:DeoR family transcriptional regulator [Alkalihalophilus pseudofirmus OF4]|uniref:DeoR family transcriptional regulator n=1 Tax=Alkalihalophilus pseudofirmus (strain ATCC BAA-2126 / JCM 17055 / OF4) TaxID=398511 RepID=D3FUF9_ALKPO|nr:MULTISPECIES: DeoR/GlpR family DNA-binding transcription regulator [Alkalihalophilus]ADC50129.1 DeoR family transcriptional regulator [Alkalihalophilus pseudofirmus OF4]MED1599878.1 DeoR/GlpR family DNA-binding transcription regulator [Alkalihalophilus marmarensis]